MYRLAPVSGPSGRRARGLALGLFMLLAGLSGLAQGEDCSLKKLAEMPIIDDNNPYVTILIDDRPRKTLIDTGGFWSLIDPGIATDLKIRSSPVTGFLGLKGIPLTKVARAQSIQLGPFKFTNGIDFLLAPPGYGLGDATLGANWLKAFDVEIDPVKKMVSLFTKDHCEGKVVYWEHSDLAVLPVDIDRSGWLTIPVKVNGEEIDALIDTGAPETTIDIDTAERLFHVTPDSPGAQPNESKTAFRYQFKSIELEGIAFNNPWIFIARMANRGPN